MRKEVGSQQLKGKAEFEVQTIDQQGSKDTAGKASFTSVASQGRQSDGR